MANIPLSNTNDLGFIFGPLKLMRIINAVVKKNDHPILIRKGISNPPLPFGYAVYKIVSLPNTPGA